jgi:hypothetical protein
MRTLRDNIYDLLSAHSTKVARQWRQSYVPVAAYASAQQEFKGIADYFFQAFSRMPPDQTHVLNCIVGNSGNVDAWMQDFRTVIAPRFVENAKFVFAPCQSLEENLTEFGALLGAY